MTEFRAWFAPDLGDVPVSRTPALERDLEGRGFVLCHPVLDAASLQRLVKRLREARERLLERPVFEIVDRLGAVGLRFLDEGDPLRAESLRLLPTASGVSRPMAAAILDGMAVDWTPERLRALVEAEFEEPSVLDRYVPRLGGSTRVLSPAFAVHVSSGSVPGVSVTSMLRSLLVKTAVLLKPGRADAVLPVLFAEALAAVDPDLAASVAVAYWPGGESGVEELALAAADLVVAYGSDASVAAVRRRLPPHVRLVAYHHRTSVAVVGREALARSRLESTMRDLTRAVSLFDQRGCVSPQVVWVEEGGEVPPREVAAALAGALRDLDEELPAGALGPDEASELQQRRGTAELLAAGGTDVAIWSGAASPWTVVFEGSSEGSSGAPGRFVRIRPISDVSQIGEVLGPLSLHLQTVAVAGLGGRSEPVVEALARIGASRITTLERAPWPPPWWHHDGMGPLQVLARWVDLEEL